MRPEALLTVAGWALELKCKSFPILSQSIQIRHRYSSKMFFIQYKVIESKSEFHGENGVSVKVSVFCNLEKGLCIQLF